MKNQNRTQVISKAALLEEPITMPIVLANTDFYRHLNKEVTFKFAKRLLDILISFVALMVLLPLMLVTAAVIKLTSKGKILFWQKRVGLNGKHFYFPKFRSMISDADHLKENLAKYNIHKDGHTFKMKNDPRITRVGRFIRKFSIDELPQLWCVLKGDMTLVGPRPATIDEVSKYDYVERKRLMVKPGLTCIWQVSGRSELSFQKQLEMDCEYIRDRSIWLDIKILFKTIPAVLTGKGAY